MQDQHAELEWRDGGVPVSVRFDDPYFSLDNGLAETRHVFVDGNDLPARFVDGFVIAERDLELRGPGEFLGQRQSGVPEFILADLAAHQDLLALAREVARGMVGPENQPVDRAQCDLLLSLFERDSAVRFLASG